MKYSDYIEGDLENSGNMRLMNKDGVDLLTRTVQDGSYQLERYESIGKNDQPSLLGRISW